MHLSNWITGSFQTDNEKSRLFQNLSVKSTEFIYLEMFYGCPLNLGDSGQLQKNRMAYSLVVKTVSNIWLFLEILLLWLYQLVHANFQSQCFQMGLLFQDQHFRYLIALGWVACKYHSMMNQTQPKKLDI